MCIICKDWQAGKLTDREAFRAIGELLGTDDEEKRRHLFELSDRILEEGDPLPEWDEEVDGQWWDENHED